MLFRSNVRVSVSVWNDGKRLTNLIRMLLAISKVLKISNIDIAFFHMTEVDACLALPFLKFKKIPSTLWYAHSYPSNYLKIFNLFGDIIFTSTIGSCPIQSAKIRVIGQSINQDTFYRPCKRLIEKSKFLTVGRIDKSKGILEIIEALSRWKILRPEISLTIYGRTLNDQYSRDVQTLVAEKNRLFSMEWIYLNPFLKRSELSKKFEEFDCFVHYFQGSLDKVLLEAASAGLPVVSINNQFNLEFHNRIKPNFDENLGDYFNSSESTLIAEINRIQRIIYEKHSLDNWVSLLSQELVQILN